MIIIKEGIKQTLNTCVYAGESIDNLKNYINSLSDKDDNATCYHKGKELPDSKMMLKDFGIQPLHKILAISTGGSKWTWDETYLKSIVELSNKNKTFKKITDHGWHGVFGNKPFDKGKHQWSIQIDAYPSSDFSGFTCGVTEEEGVEYISNNGGSSCGYKYNHLIGGTGSGYGEGMAWTSGSYGVRA